jgi:hypothetical protein
MASNRDLFGTGMFRYNEKQLYKKYLNVIELPPLAHLDSSSKEDWKFHGRFLTINAAKMKKGRVFRDKNFEGESLKEEAEAFKEKAEEERWKAYDKMMKSRAKYPELDQSGCEINTEVYYEKKKRKAAKKKRKSTKVC